MAKLVLTDLDLNSTSRITNLPDPTSAQHAATKAYVDSAIEGLNWKDSCRVATQANINLSSPGATIDGVTMATSDRVLVRSQTSASANGIYIWNGASTAMSRALDASTSAELEQAVTLVEESTSAGVSYRQTQVNLTLDTDDVLWTTFGQAAGAASESSAGIIEIATQSETNTGTDDARAVTPAKLAAYTGFTKKHAADIGDGSATSYAVTHNLGSRDVVVSVRANASPYAEVIAEVEVTDSNTVTVKFASAPTSNQYRVIVVE